MGFGRRIGVFFLVIGIFLMVLFLFSGVASAPVCGLLGWGGGLTILGSVLLWMSPKPEPQDTGRFRVIKNRNKRIKQEEKQARK